MPSGRIPPLIIQQWGKIKHDLIPVIQKSKDSAHTAEYKKDLTKKLEALYEQFDKGLRDKLKKANEAKSDADAKKVLQDIVTISTDYLNKLKTATSQWGTDGRSAAEVIKMNLERIQDAAKKTLQSIR
jgi:hypothetical protein